jgi:starvation-inducible outer membrane lipoprotein
MRERCFIRRNNSLWSLIVALMLCLSACSTTPRTKSSQAESEAELMRIHHEFMMDRMEFGHGGDR